MFSHALLHNHLGEMIFFLSKELQTEEEMLWKPVRDVIRSTISTLKNQGDCQQAVLLLEEKLFASLAPLKALVKMRLADQFIENAYTFLPNPLAIAKKGDENNGS
jgi:siderophore synthetase component